MLRIERVQEFRNMSPRMTYYSLNASRRVHFSRREISSPLPPPDPNEGSPFAHWIKLFFGSVLALLVHLWSKRWKKLKEIEDEVEVVADVMETAADMVESVAEAVEKASEEVAEKLPDDGKLKAVVEFVEHISEELVKETEVAKDIMHKVDEITEEVEGLIEPTSEKGKKDNTQ